LRICLLDSSSLLLLRKKEPPKAKAEPAKISPLPPTRKEGFGILFAEEETDEFACGVGGFGG
jgi:hypothetical protein